MGIWKWLRKRLARDHEGSDIPPGASLLDVVLGRERKKKTVSALGGYDADSYPEDLTELLRRRQQVADALLEMDVTDAEARQKAIPRLRELLRTYPHPIAFETLIHAFVDAGRWDEARGLAFAAESRRRECAESEHPEICAETDHLRSWTPEEIDRIREEREKPKKVKNKK